jgi:hypothetical protein
VPSVPVPAVPVPAVPAAVPVPAAGAAGAAVPAAGAAAVFEAEALEVAEVTLSFFKYRLAVSTFVITVSPFLLASNAEIIIALSSSVIFPLLSLLYNSGHICFQYVLSRCSL